MSLKSVYDIFHIFWACQNASAMNQRNFGFGFRSPRFLLLVSLKSVYTAEQDPKTSQASSPPPFSAFKIHLQYFSLILEHNSMLMQNFSALKILYRSLNIVFPNLCSQTRSIFFYIMLSKLRSVV